MICPKCGADLKEGAKFCNKCGSKVGEAVPAPPVKREEAAAKAPAPKKKRKSRALTIILLIVLLLVVLGVGGTAIYYLNKSNDAALMESIQKEYLEFEEDEQEEDEEDTQEAEGETEEATMATVPETEGGSAPTTAAPTQPVTQEAATAAPEPVTATVGYASQTSLSGMVRAGMVMSTAYESSHVVQADRTIDNTGWSAFDGQSVTSWQEGVDGDGIGEYVGISFDREYQVQVITLLLGNHRSDSWYVKNNTPQTLTINLSGQVFQVSFPKEKAEFAVVLSQPVAASDIRLTIDAVYSGTEYTDSIIAEVGVYGY